MNLLETIKVHHLFQLLKKNLKKKEKKSANKLCRNFTTVKSIRKLKPLTAKVKHLQPRDQCLLLFLLVGGCKQRANLEHALNGEILDD